MSDDPPFIVPTDQPFKVVPPSYFKELNVPPDSARALDDILVSRSASSYGVGNLPSAAPALHELDPLLRLEV